MNDEPLLSNVKLLNTKFDNVDGLLKGSMVTMNGFKVGSVRDMVYLSDEDSVLVEISITEPIPIPRWINCSISCSGYFGIYIH